MQKRASLKRKGQYFVYVVRCRNGTLYTGYTNDLERRIAEHNAGKGAKYLRGKGPLEVVYTREYSYYKNAVKAEAAIKRMTKGQKEKLVSA